MIQELDALKFRINDLIAYIKRDSEFDIYNQAYVDALNHVCDMINNLSQDFVFNDSVLDIDFYTKSLSDGSNSISDCK